jgi:DNA-directed RNA polymerase specialized sigma24 family protein
MSIANRWGRRWPWLTDDFRSAAGYALWRAATAWTPEKPFRFATAVHVAVRRACWDRVRREVKIAPEAFRTLPADPDVDPLQTLIDPGPAPGAELEIREEVAKLLAEATPDARAAIELHIGEGFTAEQIGRAKGTSGRNIGGMIGRGLNRMRIAASKS